MYFDHEAITGAVAGMRGIIDTRIVPKRDRVAFGVIAPTGRWTVFVDSTLDGYRIQAIDPALGGTERTVGTLGLVPGAIVDLIGLCPEEPPRPVGFAISVSRVSVTGEAGDEEMVRVAALVAAGTKEMAAGVAVLNPHVTVAVCGETVGSAEVRERVMAIPQRN